MARKINAPITTGEGSGAEVVAAEPKKPKVKNSSAKRVTSAPLQDGISDQLTRMRSQVGKVDRSLLAIQSRLDGLEQDWSARLDATRTAQVEEGQNIAAVIQRLREEMTTVQTAQNGLLANLGNLLSTYSSAVRQLRIEIDQLPRAEAVQGFIATVQQVRAEADAALSALSSSLADIGNQASSGIAEIQNQNQEGINRLDSLHDALGRLPQTDDVKDVAAKLHQLREDLTGVQSSQADHATGLRNLVAAYTSALQQLNQELAMRLDSLGAGMSQLSHTDDVKAITATVQQLRADLASAQTSQADHDTGLSNLVTAYTSALRQLNQELVMRLDSLGAAMSQLSHTDDVTAIAATVQQLRADLASAQTSQADHDTGPSNLVTATTSALQQLNREMAARLDSLQAALDQLPHTDDVKAIAATVQQLRTDLAGVQSSQTNHEAGQSNLVTSYTSTMQQLNQELATRLDSLDAGLSQLSHTDDVKDIAATVQHLHADLESVQSIQAIHETGLNNLAVAYTSALNQLNQELATRLDSLRASLDQVPHTDDVNAIAATVQQLHADLAAVQSSQANHDTGLNNLVTAYTSALQQLNQEMAKRLDSLDSGLSQLSQTDDVKAISATVQQLRADLEGIQSGQAKHDTGLTALTTATTSALQQQNQEMAKRLDSLDSGLSQLSHADEVKAISATVQQLRADLEGIQSGQAKHDTGLTTLTTTTTSALQQQNQEMAKRLDSLDSGLSQLSHADEVKAILATVQQLRADLVSVQSSQVKHETGLSNLATTYTAALQQLNQEMAKRLDSLGAGISQIWHTDEVKAIAAAVGQTREGLGVVQSNQSSLNNLTTSYSSAVQQLSNDTTTRLDALHTAMNQIPRADAVQSIAAAVQQLREALATLQTSQTSMQTSLGNLTTIYSSAIQQLGADTTTRLNALHTEINQLPSVAEVNDIAVEVQQVQADLAAGHALQGSPAAASGASEAPVIDPQPIQTMRKSSELVLAEIEKTRHELITRLDAVQQQSTAPALIRGVTHTYKWWLIVAGAAFMLFSCLGGAVSAYLIGLGNQPQTYSGVLYVTQVVTPPVFASSTFIPTWTSIPSQTLADPPTQDAAPTAGLPQGSDTGTASATPAVANETPAAGR